MGVVFVVFEASKMNGDTFFELKVRVFISRFIPTVLFYLFNYILISENYF